MPALISIIIPTYKRAAIVPRAIRSVLAQTWRPIQLIVINDGSPDNTNEVLAGMEEEIKAAGVEHLFITKENGKLSTVRNRGMKEARGEYFGFLDDDDLYTPDKLTKQMAELERTGADACCCFMTRTSGNKPRAPQEARELLRGRAGPQFVARTANGHINSLLMKTSLIPRVGEFDVDLPPYEDDEWKARLCFEATFCAVEEELGVYTWSAQAMTRVNSLEDNVKRDVAFMLHLNRIRERCSGKPGWDENAWKARALHVYDECAKHRLYVGDLKVASELYDKALEICGPNEQLRKLRVKMRKAWWMSWIGLKPRHPQMRKAV